MANEKEIIVRIENSKGNNVTFNLLDEKIIKVSGFTTTEIKNAIPLDVFFYFPGITYPETTLTGRVLARSEHPWGGSLGLNMVIGNTTLGTVSLQIAAAHDTYGHKKGPWKDTPHWNTYLKVIDPRRGFTAEDPYIAPLPWDSVHTLEDSDFLQISMTPVNPEGEKKEAKINHPLSKSSS